MSFTRNLIPLFSWPREQLESLEEGFNQLTNLPQRDIQIESDDKNVYVNIPIPGFDSSEVDISLHNGTLYIKAEHIEDKREKGKNRRIHLQSSRSYSRVITIPEQVDENNVTATTDNGMLNIQLQKVTKSGAKKIPIKKGK